MKKAILFCLSVCLLFSVSGCAGAAEAKTLQVTATFYPLYLAAVNIVGDAPGVTVSSLAPPEAGCLHDYQMTTADRRALSDSDIIVMNGAGLEAFLAPLLPQLGARTIDASEGIDLLPGAHEETNPHVWVSVDGAMRQVENIAEGLMALDPSRADLYRENAEAYLQRLGALKARMREALQPFEGEPIVTFHEAFDYFAEEFGLRVVAVIGEEPGDAPSAREMAEVADKIRAEHVRALFAEPQYEDLSAKLLSRETGVPMYVLDPVVSGETDGTDRDAYLRIMEQNMQTLVEALS